MTTQAKRSEIQGQPHRRRRVSDYYMEGGFKSEVQHLQPCKVRRCKAPQDTTSNFSLKSA